MISLTLKRISGEMTNAMPWRKTILDLCGGTGSWSEPYAEAGYNVNVVDPYSPVEGAVLEDVRLYVPPTGVHGILAAPPCTEFAGSGARWWAGKGERALLEGLSVTDACLRIITVTRPEWWVLENPVGRLVHYLGPPRMSFDPCDYGDPYTKRTLLWGEFNVPAQNPVEPTMGSLIHKMWSRQKVERSMTPSGFARAFFESNP